MAEAYMLSASETESRQNKFFRIKPSEPIKLIKIAPGSDNITHNAQGLDRWVRSNAGNLAYRDD